jgi:alpha-tubulin suppressor-like RCC1 family protein
MRFVALRAARGPALALCTFTSLLVTLSACGDDDGGTIVDVDASVDAFVEDASLDVDGGNVDMRVTCTSDVDCNDGLFCNGREMCAPASTMADARGCVPGDAPCETTETCDEPANDCRTICEDLDGDGYEAVACGGDDCDDNDATRYPGATEICDGNDEDCNDATFGFVDADMDGAGAAACCNGTICGTDCDDANASVRPGVADGPTMNCNTVDDDCDGIPDVGCPCSDGERRPCYGGPAGTRGIGLCTDGISICAGGVLGAECLEDVLPSDEFCNDRDDDCDGLTDDGVRPRFYRDDDGDNFGQTSVFIDDQCSPPPGFAAGANDCDDTNPGRFPGADDLCNLIDDDCDGTDDENAPPVTYYRDADGDGFGDATMQLLVCGAPAGYIAAGGDCDDTRPFVSPVGVEQCDASATPLDEDCDGSINEDCACADGETRTCGGGSPVQGACRAGVQRCIGGAWAGCSGNIDPGTLTETCNGIDDDCDGSSDETLLAPSCYVDSDSDGYGSGAALTALCADPARTDVGRCPSGYTSVGGTPSTSDCNDANGTTRPGASESCNGVDDDCDGTVDEGVTRTFYRDADGDGFGLLSMALTACAAPAGYVATSTDCDDTRASSSPAGFEICDAAVRDEDCDSTANEGCACVEGATQACGGGTPARGVCRAGTQRCIGGVWAPCEGNVDPGSRTETCNGTDDDCDGMTDESLLAASCYLDADSDGYGSGAEFTALCADTVRASVGNCPSGYTNRGGTSALTDCNDSNAAIRPLGTEVCNTIDDDCDGIADEGATTSYYRDADGDGFGAGTATTACAAPTGFVTNATDCDDMRASSSPSGTEVCDAALRDEDCDSTANEGCACTDGTSRACGGGSPVRGVCRAGTQLCIAGAWASCSGNIDPATVTETCNGLDDDCDGATDETLLATGCYVDADSDGFGSGALITTLCRDASRTAVGFCPSGYSNVAGDCNDSNGATRPMGAELCNTIDDDCDGMTDEGVTASYYRDADGDGFGAGSASVACTAPPGFVTNATDCDDARSNVSPAGTEVCDAAMRNEDCDASANEGCACTEGATQGCGGGMPVRGVCRAGTQICIAGAWASCSGNIEPGTLTETCNGFDDDCDGMTDESLLAASCYLDADSDGYGSGAVITTLCRDGSRLAFGLCPSGYSNAAGDCNDGNGATRPMGAEVCNGTDDDCDGSTDEGVATSYFRDADGDGFGAGTATLGCTAPTGYVANATDCDDTRGSVSPSAAEVCDASMRDEDCDATANEGCTCTDGASRACGGGSPIRGVCRAGTQLCTAGTWASCSGNIDPATLTESCNGLDDDCDGLTDESLLAASCYVDADSDGFGSGAVLTTLCRDASRTTVGFCPSGYSNVAGDCNDSNGATRPMGTEVCNGTDDDCDGMTDESVTLSYFRDADGDGFGAGTATIGCSAPTGFVANATDCDDTRGSVSPAGTEICDTAMRDEDCDSTANEGCTCTDGSSRACGGGSPIRGVCRAGAQLCLAGTWAACSGNIDPGTLTESCNGLDDDCDGLTDESLLAASCYVDADSDGFGSGTALTTLCRDASRMAFGFCPSGYSNVAGDCNDSNGGTRPMGAEVCNGTDDDCDGSTDEGVTTSYYRDADGDGFGTGTAAVGCTAPTGYVANGTDCDDARASVSPSASEVCDATTRDDDCDGMANEGCACVDGASRACGGGSPIRGACRAGSQLCIAGAWATCSGNIEPGTVAETCNGVDDDCDGTTDETLLAASCYVDADSDGYGTGAVITSLCADATRTSVGSCPTGFTNRGGTAANTDCNDGNGSIRPLAAEVCNSVDDDCDGSTDESVTTSYYRDADGDGFGAGAAMTGCSAPSGYVANGTDCDDMRGNVSPSATEICDAAIRDDDCDGMANEGCACVDGTSRACGGGSPIRGACRAGTQLCIAGAYAACTGSIEPGTIAETCNGVDDDCDGSTDETLLAASCYVDSDSDGYGAGAVINTLCADTMRAAFGNCPTGFTNRGGASGMTDCNDGNGSIRPMATEVCNATDDDCDGMTDEGVTTSYYRDADGDSFGAGTATVGCSAPTGYVANGTDCDDTRGGVSPAGTEVCDSSMRDEDCDSTANEGCACVDGTSRACGGGSPIRGICRAGSQLCIAGAWGTCTGNIDPASVAETCNGLDDDCDGTTDESLLAATCYVDADSDGYGTGTAITTLCADSSRSAFGSCPSGYSNVAGDCNDSNSSRSPARTETCNGVDDDCDGSVDESLIAASCFVDSDGDGYGSGAALTTLCADSARTSFGSCPSGYTNVGGTSTTADCNDVNALVSPGRTEICNSVDDDCDGMTDESLRVTCAVDGDSDGFGAGATSSQCRDSARTSVGFCPVGYSNVTTDCNDSLASVRPMGTESCNGIDDDCDGSTDEGVLIAYYRDADGDAYGLTSTTSTGCSAPAGYVAASGDCNDGNASIRPGAPEICDGVDQNCASGTTDEPVRTFYRDADGDLYGTSATTTSACSPPSGYVEYSGDCNDADGNVRPGLIDLCNNVDDDCDGTTDEGASALCAGENPFARNVTGWACTMGTCAVSTCSGSYRNCNSNTVDGCESNTATDTSHCGACGTTCGLSALCTAGACEGIRDLFAGGDTTCIVRATTGRLVCWGEGDKGELNSLTVDDSTVPVAVPDLVDVSTGDIGENFSATGSAVLASTADGNTFGWGVNTGGQLGDGTTLSPRVPATFISGLSDQTAVGWAHGCLKNGGLVRCSGSNGETQLGNTTTTASNTMISVTGFGSATDLAAGGFHSCVRNTSSQIYCWGNDSFGQLGNDAALVDSVPVAVSGISTGANVECGAQHTCALLSSQVARCWGNNADGQLGNTSTTNAATPVVVSGGYTYSALALGDAHSCGLMTTGVVRCWGSDDFGQMGNGVTTGDQTAPGLVSGITGTVVDVASGRGHSCARTSANRVYCWGANNAGQIGVGSTTNQTTAVLVPGL